MLVPIESTKPSAARAGSPARVIEGSAQASAKPMARLIWNRVDFPSTSDALPGRCCARRQGACYRRTRSSSIGFPGSHFSATPHEVMMGSTRGGGAVRAMAKNIQAPDDVQIASMKTEYERIGNLLAPGPGTPWEDRGSIGPIPAFFKTAIMSMTSPRTLLFSLRRPETPGDARAFAIICGLFWGLSWVLHDYIHFKRFSREPFDITSDGELWILHFILGSAGTWVLLNLVSRLFYKLVAAGEMKAAAPQVLTYNVYAYCLGPSILALIPFYIRPAIALGSIVGAV